MTHKCEQVDRFKASKAVRRKLGGREVNSCDAGTMVLIRIRLSGRSSFRTDTVSNPDNLRSTVERADTQHV